MANKKILLVEDDPNFGTVLKDYLALNDYDVHHAKDGLDGLIAFKNDDFDICILDVMMPKKDGFSLAKDIRAVNLDIPIIFLTAKSMKEDVLKGYQVGADDYLNTSSDFSNAYSLVSDAESVQVDYILSGPQGTTKDAAVAKANAILNIVNSRKDCIAFFSPMRTDVIGQTNSDLITERVLSYFQDISSTSYDVKS